VYEEEESWKLKIMFTEWELKILKLMMEGLSNRKISQVLELSPVMTGNHIGRILKKTRTKNRTTAVYIAAKNNYI
jgi:DNA-binding NarL/FixJ family response regulator